MNPKPRVNLDADHTGHLLCVVCEYLNSIRLHIEDYLESDDTDSRVTQTLNLMDKFYLAGNIEGRLLAENINEEDLVILDCWEEELKGLKAESKEDVTLVIVSHAPVAWQTQTVWRTARIRRYIKERFPLCEPKIIWLTEEAEEYGSIQLVMQILVSPECVDTMLGVATRALHKAEMAVDDHWEDEA